MVVPIAVMSLNRLMSRVVQAALLFFFDEAPVLHCTHTIMRYKQKCHSMGLDGFGEYQLLAKPSEAFLTGTVLPTEDSE